LVSQKESLPAHHLVHPTAKQMAQTKVVRKEWMMGYQKAGAWVRQTVHLMDMMLVGWWDLQMDAHLSRQMARCMALLTIDQKVDQMVSRKEQQTALQWVHPKEKQMDLKVDLTAAKTAK
jgi:hypothetical protein